MELFATRSWAATFSTLTQRASGPYQPSSIDSSVRILRNPTKVDSLGDNVSTGPVGTHYDLRRVESPRYFRIAFRITSDFGMSSSIALLSSAATSPGSRRNTTFLLLRSFSTSGGRPIRFFTRFVTLRRNSRFLPHGPCRQCTHSTKSISVMQKLHSLRNAFSVYLLQCNNEAEPMHRARRANSDWRLERWFGGTRVELEGRGQ